MIVLNKALINDIKNNTPIYLNLGGGLQSVQNYYNVDFVKLPGVDIVADLNKPLDELPDNIVSGIYSSNTFEHISNLFGLLSEIHRVCRNGAKCEIIVPHFANPYYYSDPTHVRQFGLFTMHYLVNNDQQWRRKVPNYYSETKFKLNDVKLMFYKDSLFDHLISPSANYLVNKSRFTQHLFERRFCWFFPPAQVKYILQIEK